MRLSDLMKFFESESGDSKLQDLVQVIMGVATIASIWKLYNELRDMRQSMRKVTQIIENKYSSELKKAGTNSSRRSSAKNKTTVFKSNSSYKIEGGWYFINSLNVMLHKILFDKGIIVIVVPGTKKQLKCIVNEKADFFAIKNRKFSITRNENKAVREVIRNMLKLKVSRDNYKSPFFVYEKSHGGRAYIPYRISSDKAILAQFWASDSNITSISSEIEFNVAVTAGCMFGGALLGVNQNGRSSPLIKHDIQFCEGEKIDSIVYRENANAGVPYEEANFREFSYVVRFLDSNRRSGQRLKLYYHLPTVDYILFAMNIYLRGHMVKKAFTRLIELVIAKKVEYSQRLQSIVAGMEIDLIIQSPFDDILTLDKDSKARPVVKLLEQKILALQSKPMTKEGYNETRIVNKCLELLSEGSEKSQLAALWNCLLTEVVEERERKVEGIATVEGLLKMGNAIMVARASYGQKPYECCCIQSMSEQQIQIGYQKIAKVMALPAIYCVTYLEPAICYGPENDTGKLFYASDPSVTGLIKHGITSSGASLVDEANRNLNQILEGSTDSKLTMG